MTEMAQAPLESGQSRPETDRALTSHLHRSEGGALTLALPLTAIAADNALNKNTTPLFPFGHVGF